MEKPLLDSSLVHNRRPIPEFVLETPFSQRKRTPFRAPRPPKAPAKTCPPVSRIFPTPKSSVGPRLVSFKTEGNHNGVLVKMLKGVCKLATYLPYRAELSSL